MTHTTLLTEILEQANRIKEEFGSESLYASHIVVAVVEFCHTKYTGFSVSDMTYWPNRFEEERLRYLCSKETRVASYFRIHLSCNAKDGVQEEAFDMAYCERIAAARGAKTLSVDVVFLCALTKLHESYKRAVRNVKSAESVMARLQELDVNIYDYVITQIDSVCAALKQKSDEAAAIRDWKPAEKFAECDDLLKQFFDRICVAYENNVLQITIPEFFRESDLTLSIYKVNDYFIVHDNACATKSLSTRIDAIRVQKVLELLWDKSNLQDGKLFTQITDAKSVLYFIQEVILTANADLYYEYFKEETFGHRRYIDPCKAFESEQLAEAFDYGAFCNALKETVTAYYDENKGLMLRFDAKYCHCSYGIKVLLETLDNGTVRFSDAYKNKQYETGEMLEAFYFSSTEEYDAMYYGVMQALAKPFGVVFDMTSSIVFPEYNGRKHNHKNPYMLSTAQNWVQDFYKFMNGAVLISVVADRINYEKVREW